jgi:two-component system, response regulator PdtaR
MASEAHDATKGLRIAVADDDPDTRQFYAELLPSMGHQIAAVAENGRQLVEQCRSTHTDLIITDIRMPELGGIEAAEQINREREVPVILVSGYQETEFLAFARSSSC